MAGKLVMGLVVLGLLLAAPGATVSACCDWTPQDTAFWGKMSENPQKFSYDMGARSTHFRIRTGGEEEVLTPESAQKDDLWRHMLHHLNPKHHNAAPGRKVHERTRP